MITPITKSFFTTIFVSCVLSAFAQKKFTHVINEHDNKIEFRSDGKTLSKVIDVNSINPYLSLPYTFIKSSRGNEHKIKPEERMSILKLFAIDDSKQRFSNGTLSTYSSVADFSNNHIVVTSHLMLLSYGIVAIKSIATVYNGDGTINAILPENNDGYFEPVVNDNGQFLATNYGDICGDCDYSVVPFPGFRIYHLTTGKIIYDIQPQRAELHSPTIVGNLIVQVLGVASNQFAYLVIDPAQRQIYTRTFTTEDIGKFVRFDERGLFIKTQDGEDYLRYDVAFDKSWF